MVPLRVETLLWVGRVVDYLKLSLLVVETIPSMKDSIVVSLLIFELSVVSHPCIISVSIRVRSVLTVDLKREPLWIIVRLPCVGRSACVHS